MGMADSLLDELRPRKAAAPSYDAWNLARMQADTDKAWSHDILSDPTMADSLLDELRPRKAAAPSYDAWNLTQMQADKAWSHGIALTAEISECVSYPCEHAGQDEHGGARRDQ